MKRWLIVLIDGSMIDCINADTEQEAIYWCKKEFGDSFKMVIEFV